MRKGLSSHVRHYATCDGCDKTIYGARYKCMHPNCPDFDLCGACEAHPIPIHPSNHPMLKMKTPDTFLPTVYRITGPHCTRGAHTHGERRKTVVKEEEKGRPLPTPPMQTTLVNEKVEPEAPSLVECAVEVEPPSLESSSAGFTLPPILLDPRSDLFREFWPKVTEEFKHLIPDVKASAPVEEFGMKLRQADTIVNEKSVMTADDPFRDPEPKSSINTSPDISSQTLLARPMPAVVPDMVQHTTAPVTTLPISLATLLNDYRSPAPSLSTLAVSTIGTEVTEPDATTPDDTSSSLSQTIQALPISLMASFICDTTVHDGTIFPPGAEFVKSWRMLNNGITDWPETTELHYTSGEKFSFGSERVRVGKVTPGQEVDVWTGELKVMSIHYVLQIINNLHP